MYLALGDSYTIGEGVDQNKTYPNILKQFLDKHNVSAEVTVIAKTGWTSQELFEAYDKRNLKREYDLVSLLVGVNNQYRKHSFDYFAKGFETMLNEAISRSILGESNVVVISIPNYGLTPFGKGKDKEEEITIDITNYNKHIKQRCDLYGVRYFDINEVYNTKASQYIIEDNLHPSAEMYQEWVDFFKEDVLKLLSNKV